MANLRVNKKFGTIYVRFRFGGRYYQRAIGTKSRRIAEAAAVRVEEMIRLIETGRINLPPNVDPIPALRFTRQAPIP